MDERTDGISRRQLSILLFVSALSPLIRQAPGMAVQSAGSAVWLSALLALVPLPLAGLLLGRLTRKRVPGEGLGGVLLRVFGRFGGTAAVLLYTAWTVFYAGFVLRAGADRFVTAVYPGSRPWLFHGGDGGAVRSGVSRTAQNARTLRGDRAAAACARISVRVPLLPAGAGRGKPRADIERFSRRCRAARRGFLSTMSVLLLLAFLSDRTEPGPLAAPFNRAFLALGLLAALLCVTVVATFGAKLTAEMYYPFFRYDPVHPHLPPARARGGARRGAVGHDRLSPARRAFCRRQQASSRCASRSSGRGAAPLLTCLALALLSGALCAPTAFSCGSCRARSCPLPAPPPPGCSCWRSSSG